MELRSIKLSEFKNYERANVDFHPRVNVIVGPNGVGKTNLLDAIYFLCFTKSYFSNSDRHAYRKGYDFFRMEGILEVADGSEEEIVIQSAVSGGKAIFNNRVKLERRSDHIGRFPAVMIAPDDNQLILGGSEGRRKFMDGCIGQYDRSYLLDLLQYQKTIKQRNAVLKANLKSGQFDPILLDTLDEGLARKGDSIHAGRVVFVDRLRKLFDQRYVSIACKEEKPSIEYISVVHDHPMQEVFKNSRSADLASGRSTKGIHRDDLEFRIFDQPLKMAGSQGQQKSFLVSLKLAQYEMLNQHTGAKPFLLLDDLFDKFDHQRVSHIMAMMQDDVFGQVFVTDTDEERVVDSLKLHNLDHKIIRVDDGKLSYG